MKHSQRGYSLVELSIVLAIIAVVIAGAITGVQSILRSNNVNRTIAATNKAVGSIVSKYVRDPNYANVTMANLVQPSMEIWDRKDVTSTAGSEAVVHAFGGRVIVASATAWGAWVADQGFVYTLANIPLAACADVALGIESLGAGMTINNSGATAVTAAQQMGTGDALVKDTTTPVTTTKVNKACGTGATATISIFVPRS